LGLVDDDEAQRAPVGKAASPLVRLTRDVEVAIERDRIKAGGERTRPIGELGPRAATLLVDRTTAVKELIFCVCSLALLVSAEVFRGTSRLVMTSRM